MLMYIFLFLLSSFLALLDVSKISKSKKISMGLFFSFVLLFLSGIRWETGTDWSLYFGFFDQNDSFRDFITNDANNQGIEFGYGILNFIIKNLFNDYNVGLFIIAFLIIGIKFRWIYKYSMFPMVALFISFTTYLGDVFFVRQTLAIAITLIGFDFIIKKKKYMFLLMVALAGTIHTSAIIFFPAYWIYHMNISNKKLIGVATCALVFDVCGIGTFILKEFMSIFSADDGKVFQKLYAYYLLGEQDENFGQAVDGTTRMFLAYIRRLVFLPFFFYFFKKLSAQDPYYEGCLKLVVFGHAMFFLTSIISIDFAGRLSLYYYVYEILLISSFMNLGDKLSSKMGIFFVIFMYSMAKYFYLLYSLGEYYIPFHTLFYFY